MITYKYTRKNLSSVANVFRQLGTEHWSTHRTSILMTNGVLLSTVFARVEDCCYWCLFWGCTAFKCKLRRVRFAIM